MGKEFPLKQLVDNSLSLLILKVNVNNIKRVVNGALKDLVALNV